MFRIEFFVDDKKVGPALVALVGVAHGQPSVQPVVNAVKTGNGLAAATGGKGVDRVAHLLKKVQPGTALSGKEFRVLLKNAGLSVASSSYYVAEAVKAGLLKKTGSTSDARYLVL